MQIDLKVAQLMSSRLCHDLVSPAGAVNAGLEMLEGGGFDDEAMALVQSSGAAVAAKLAFFRTAYGLGGAASDGTMKVSEVKDLIEGVKGQRVSFSWSETLPEAIPSSAGRLLLNMLLLGMECLGRGGVISVVMAELDDGLGLAVGADGADAKVKDDIALALNISAPTAVLTPRNVHGYYTVKLAETMHAGLEIHGSQPDSVRLAAVFPKS